MLDWRNRHSGCRSPPTGSSRKARGCSRSAGPGHYYWTADGRQVLDGQAGLWCVNAGIAARKSSRRCGPGRRDGFRATFQMGHPIAFEFAERLAGSRRGSRTFFSSHLGFRVGRHGAEDRARLPPGARQGQRFRLIGRERGYHGVNFGGMAVGAFPPTARLRPGRGRRKPHPPHARPGKKRVFERPARPRRRFRRRP